MGNGFTDQSLAAIITEGLLTITGNMSVIVPSVNTPISASDPSPSVPTTRPTSPLPIVAPAPNLR